MYNAMTRTRNLKRFLSLSLLLVVFVQNFEVEKAKYGRLNFPNNSLPRTNFRFVTKLSLEQNLTLKIFQLELYHICLFCSFQFHALIVYFIFHFFFCRKRKIVVHHVMHYFLKRTNVQYYVTGLDHGLPFAVPAVYLR